MQRRRQFIGTVSGLTATGLAGCLARDGADDSASEQSDSQTGDESATRSNDSPPTEDESDPAETVESFMRTRLDVIGTEQQFFHSLTQPAELELLSVETDVIENDVGVDTIADETAIDRDDLAPEVTDEETALVAADFELREGGETRQEHEEWFLATEDGEWQILGTPAQVESGTETSETVANNVNIIVEVGAVGTHGADADQIGEVRLGLQPAAGADDINLANLTLQYVSDNDFANIVAGTAGGEPAGAETAPETIETDDTDEEQYDVEVVTAESRDNLLMTDDADRYEIVIPLDQGNLSPLDEGERVEITITMENGAQTVAFLQVPESLAGENEGETVNL